jgi:hypothetical protein
MKKSLIGSLAAVALVLPLLAGCDQTTEPIESAPAGVANEVDAMKYFATNDEFVVNAEATLDDGEIASVDFGTFGKIDAEITPLRFGRFVTGITKNVELEIEPGDTIAIAHVTRTANGVLKVRGVNAAQETVLVEKPFTDQSVRNVVFKRVARETKRYWMNWIPVATSLVKGGTVSPASNVTITKMTLELPDGKTIEITDPEQYFLRYRWKYMFVNQRCTDDVPEFQAGQAVKLQVTVESASADTDIVVLRYGYLGLNKRRTRLELVSEEMSGGVYVRVYEISKVRPLYMHFHRGFFNMAVDAMTRETLFDDTAPYSVSWWGVPYRVF